jgi:hypothetical protein
VENYHDKATAALLKHLAYLDREWEAEDRAVTHLRAALDTQAEARERVARSYESASARIIAGLDKEIDRQQLAALTGRDFAEQRIRAEEAITIAVIQHAIQEAYWLATMSSNWSAYAQTVWKAQEAIEATNVAAIHQIFVLRSGGEAARLWGGEMRNALGQTATALSQLAGSVQGTGGIWLRILDQIANQIIRNIALVKAEAVAKKAVELSNLQIALSAIKQIAIVRAAIEMAEGFASLATQHYKEAALHFLSAAVFGSVGALQVAAVVGALGGGAEAVLAGEELPPRARGPARRNSRRQGRTSTSTFTVRCMEAGQGSRSWSGMCQMR